MFNIDSDTCVVCHQVVFDFMQTVYVESPKRRHFRALTRSDLHPQTFNLSSETIFLTTILLSEPCLLFKYLMDEDNNGNYEVFRDCMSAAIIDKSSRNTPRQPKKRLSKGRKGSTATLITSNAKGDGAASIVTGNDDPADLADFIEVAISTSHECSPYIISKSHSI